MRMKPDWFDEWVYNDGKTFGFKLKDGAPEDVKKEFEEWTKESDDV